MMGKFYELTKYKNDLTAKLADLSMSVEIENKFCVLNSIKKTNPNFATEINNFIDEYQIIKSQDEKIIKLIKTSINQLNDDIDAVARELFSGDDYQNKFIEHNIVQNIELNTINYNHIVSKISQYVDWHFPTLLINPRDKKWIDQMVAGDPLYITHYNINDVNEMINGYSSLYRSRLRLYQIKDRNFSFLPQGQFGFILCWDIFNYLSLEKIEQYLKEVWSLLRPGGVFMFSYVNCDLEAPAFRAECQAHSYSSFRNLVKFAEDLGYELIKSDDLETDDAFNTHTSLMEIKRPGELKTIKLRQAMAEIIEK